MTDYIEASGLRIARVLDELVREHIAPGTGIEPARVWQLLAELIRDIGARHRALPAHASGHGLGAARACGDRHR